VNAFALPGGYIYVTRGVMAYMDSEADLAGVIGHEMGHYIVNNMYQEYRMGIRTVSILVIEDNPTDVMLMREALASAKLHIGLHVVHDGVVGLSGAFASEWSMLSMYLLFIAVITFRARGLFGRKSVLDQ